MKRAVLGPNTYLARQRLNDLLNSVERDSIEQFDGENLDLNRLSEVLQAQSLFSAPTVVVSGVSTQKTIHDQILKMIEETDSSLDLIIYEPQIDKRSKYYKQLLKITEADEFKQLDAFALGDWLVGVAKNRDSEISRSNANYLVEIVGEDQWQLSNELDKLIAMNSPIDQKLIDELVEPTPKESIFNLLDAVVSGRSKQAITQYDNLISNRVEPNYIVSMLAWQLHISAVVVYAGTKSSDQIAKDAGISPFVVKKTKNSVSKLSKSKLRTMLVAASETDAQLKSVSIDQTEAVKQLVIKLAN